METKRMKTRQHCVHCKKWTQFTIRSTYWIPLCEDCCGILVEAHEIRRLMDKRRNLIHRERKGSIPVFVF